MGRSALEDIKDASMYLRGTIAEELANDSAKFDGDTCQLLKFHGSYQQDDRDLRSERRKQDLDRYFMLMVRTAIPGGAVTAKQYLAHDRIVDKFGNGTLRVTSRQGLQTHAVLKENMKGCVQAINACGLSTKGACGDVVRNIMATPVPLDTPAHRDVQALAQEFRKHFVAKTNAYTEIWLDGEKVEEDLGDVEPIYGKLYLPRKFKIGIAVPPRNDVDVYTHDAGVVPYCPDGPNGEVAGYTFIIGGGMGMSNGKEDTYPALGKPFCYVPREKVVETMIAIVKTQRDHGNREDRKQARLKYLLAKQGFDWMREQVESRLEFKLEAPKELAWETVADPLGWNDQGDGRLFLGVWVQDGRIKDGEKVRYRAAFREISERFGFPIGLTPNCSLLFRDVDPSQKDEVDEILARNGVVHSDDFTEAKKTCMACVALPTCGLALAESERALPGVMDEIDAILRELDLADEPLLIRMTGCPNGCARPYNADLAFVGRGPDRYAMFAGGSSRGDRMACLYRHTVKREEVSDRVRECLTDFKANRNDGEIFSDYWGRSGKANETPEPGQFHTPLEEG